MLSIDRILDIPKDRTEQVALENTRINRFRKGPNTHPSRWISRPHCEIGLRWFGSLCVRSARYCEHEQYGELRLSGNDRSVHVKPQLDSLVEDRY
jgi:hypothetical protein